MSEKVMLKLNDIQFRKITNQNWFQTVAMWVIDSKYRKTKQLDTFLSDQLKFMTTKSEIYKTALSLRGKNHILTVRNIEEYVITKFKYKTDQVNFGMAEYWADAEETFRKKTDDCEGLNSLIYLMCILAGVGSSCLYCCIGKVKSGILHFWVLFFDTGKGRDRWVRLDAAYRPKVEPIELKPEFKLGGDYQTIDFIFNENGIWKWR